MQDWSQFKRFAKRIFVCKIIIYEKHPQMAKIAFLYWKMVTFAIFLPIFRKRIEAKLNELESESDILAQKLEILNVTPPIKTFP